MDKRAFKNFITKRSSIWTISLCMTGILVLGGIAAVDKTRRANDEQPETEIGQVAYLEEEIDPSDDIEESLFPTLQEEMTEDLAQASGSTVEEESEFSNEAADEAEEGDEVQVSADHVESSGENTDVPSDTTAADAAEEASSSQVISEQALLQEGISFTEDESLMWPAAGTILIDYSMDGSVYFPTLNQYKYNPALIIGSDVGNQVLASAKGIVESVTIDEETGNTLVLNLGNGYKLTYGQLKELAVSEGDVVEEGALLGYVSEPTKYYSEEGSNLYFAMTQNDTAVDPVLYLE
ncbi:MAG: M23 family metallopeptidase [Lachnospiraceae bacterium]|nr:M23 family metallopeptidase [Lachnospiraceae bacterium]